MWRFVQAYPDKDELMFEECDILIPAALEKVINSTNAHKVKAKIIGEAANGPITPKGDQILRESGCLVIPDLYLVIDFSPVFFGQKVSYLATERRWRDRVLL